jgi:glutamine cyclotransferase
MWQQSNIARFVAAFFPSKSSRTRGARPRRALAFRAIRFEPLEQRALLSAAGGGKGAFAASALVGPTQPAGKPQQRALPAAAIEHRAGPALASSAPVGHAVSAEPAIAGAIASSVPSAGRLYAICVSGKEGMIYEVNPMDGSTIRSFKAPAEIGQAGCQGLALGPTSLFFIEGSVGEQRLYELDLDTGAVIDEDVFNLNGTERILGLAYYDGMIYLGNFDKKKVLIWDPDADKIVGSLTAKYGCGGGLTGADSLGLLFDSNLYGQIVSINPANGVSTIVKRENKTQPMSGGLAFIGEELLAGERVAPGRIYRVDPNSGDVLGTFTLACPGTLTGLAGDGLVGSALPPGEIRGHHWNDLDGNGSWDAGEPPLAGWTVFLDANQNGVLDAGEASTLTGSGGEYALTEVAPGAHTVAVELPPGWTQTCPSEVPSAGRLYALWVNKVTKKATIVELDPSDGRAINSFSAPGVISKEGLQGLALGPDRLYYIDGTGDVVHTLYGLELDTGQILEQDVVDPHYRLKISGLGYLDGQVYLHQQGQGTILVWDPVSDAEVRRLTTVNTSLHGGFTGAADLGLLFDSNEVGTVYAINPRTGNVVRKMETGAGSLKRGMAYLNGELIAVDSGSPMAKRIDPQTGALLGEFPVGGSEYGSLSGLAGDGATEWFGPPTRTVVLQSEEVIENVDFGSGQFAEIRGRMWHDLDGDGIRDDGEPPLEGWTIFLDADGDGVFKSGERSATTDAWGNYVFTLVPPGRHAVAEVLRSDWLPTFPRQPSSKGRLYAIWGDDCHGSGSTIARIDPLTGSVLSSFATPVATSYSGPQGLALGPESLFYIDGGTDNEQILYQLDLETGAVLSSCTVCEDPETEITGMAYLDGLIYLERCDADQILVWDPAAESVVETFTVACDLGGSLTGAAGLGLLFAGNAVGEIVAIDPASGQVLRTVATGEGPFDGGLAYVDGVLLAAAYMAPVAQRIDPETGTVIGRLPLENPSRGHLSGLAADGVGGGPGGGHIVDAAPGCVVANLDFGNRYSPPSAAPAAVDLAAESDTGFSSTDDLTRLDNSAPSLSLDLIVDGTVAGAIVEVYAGGALIGSGTAAGNVTRITTRGDYALADGPHAITARQTEVGKQPSPLSPPLTITIDTAGPVAEILAVAPNPRNTPVEAVDILLSEKVFGVAAGSFSLAIDGGGNLLSGEEPITSPDQQRYTLGGLSPMTQRAGRYRLVLTAGDQIRDLAGNPLAAGASGEWTQSLARHTGTQGADAVTFTTGAAHTLTINGRAYVYDPAVVSELVVDGAGGADSIAITGSTGDEEVLLDGTSVVVTGPGYELRATGFARIAVNAGAGENDAAMMRGSSGSLRLYSYAGWSALCDSAGSFYHRVERFETVAVEAAATGSDYAFLYDSSGDDRLTASEDKVEMDRAPGWTDTAVSGFARVYAYASEGFDTAGLAGSPPYANRFYGYPDYSILTDSTGSFYYYASGFDAVTAVAAAGGVQYAYLYDSAGADRLEASPSETAMHRAAPWSDTTAKGFSRVYAYSIRGGDDSAVLAGSAAGGNRFYGYANYGTLSDSAGSFYHFASGFAELAASAAGSGNTAYLYGSSGNDVLTARPARVEFDRAAGWSDTVATGFERVYAYASGGGLDRAYLYASSGNDTLFGRGDYGYLTDSRGSYYLYFKYFDEVFAHSEDDDKSTRDIVNVNPSLLYLLELEGTW